MDTLNETEIASRSSLFISFDISLREIMALIVVAEIECALRIVFLRLSIFLINFWNLYLDHLANFELYTF